MLEQSGVDVKNLNLNRLINEYEKLTQSRSELNHTYQSASKEMNELQLHLSELQQFFQKDVPDKKISKSVYLKNTTSLS